MADITAPLSVFNELLRTLKITAGGIAGLYVLFLIFKVREHFVMRRMFRDIGLRLDRLEHHFKIKHIDRPTKIEKLKSIIRRGR